MSRMQRNRKKIPKSKKKKHKLPNSGICPNCGVRESHFVPPFAGEPGFFICQIDKQYIEPY